MLIATRCRKDFMNTMPPPCPEAQVQSRIDLVVLSPNEPIPMYDEGAVAPELNAICDPCPEWEPIHEKPESRIFYACDVVDTTVCPHQEVSPAFVKSDADIVRFDDLCRPCRLFYPRPSV